MHFFSIVGIPGNIVHVTVKSVGPEPRGHHPLIFPLESSAGVWVGLHNMWLVAEFLSPPFPEEMLMIGFYHCSQIKRHFLANLSQTVGLQSVSFDLLPFSSANKCDPMQSSQFRKLQIMPRNKRTLLTQNEVFNSELYLLSRFDAKRIF